MKSINEALSTNHKKVQHLMQLTMAMGTTNLGTVAGSRDMPFSATAMLENSIRGPWGPVREVNDWNQKRPQRVGDYMGVLKLGIYPCIYTCACLYTHVHADINACIHTRTHGCRHVQIYIWQMPGLGPLMRTSTCIYMQHLGKAHEFEASNGFQPLPTFTN